VILARLRQVGTWFLIGLGCALGIVVAILLRRLGEKRDGIDGVLEYTNDRVQLANARAAVEITAARTKNAAVKAELREVVQSDRSEADKVRELVAMKERMDRS
jgi:hypothetical protein